MNDTKFNHLVSMDILNFFVKARPHFADMALPVGLATHNSLCPHWKWHIVVAMYTDEDLLVAMGAVILIDQESHEPRN